MTDGPCSAHGCDNCNTCQLGKCCRRDNPDYQLPRLGEWTGPIYGQLGRLSRSYESVQCHVCGMDFIKLGGHLWYAHDLLAAEYRSIFGLNKSTPLCSEDSSGRHAVVMKQRRLTDSRLYQRGPHNFADDTPEQRDQMRYAGSHAGVRLEEQIRRSRTMRSIGSRRGKYDTGTGSTAAAKRSHVTRARKPELLSRLLGKLERGESIHSCAVVLGISLQTVYRWLRAEGWSRCDMCMTLTASGHICE